MKATPLIVLCLSCVLLGAGCAPAPAPEPLKPPIPNAGTVAPPPAAPAAAIPATPPTAVKKPVTKPVTVPTTTPTPAPATQTTFTASQMIPTVTVAAYGSDIHWSMYSNPDFKGYALIKSTVDTNPYYPKQEWFRFENRDVNARFYQDRNLVKGKRTYYRVCAINADDSIICGPVTSVVF